MNELLPFPNSNIILTSHENTSCTVSSTSMMETLHDLLQRISSQYNIPSHLLTSQVLIQTNSHENLASNSTNLPPLNSSFEHLMELAHSSWISNFLLQINNLLLYLRPAMTTLLQQKVILDHIVKILYKCLGTIAFPIGVAITHVILPGEKIDMTVFLPNPVDTKWHLKFHETLYPDNPLENPPQLTSVQFFNKEKTASLSYGDIGVNISVNDIAALYNSALYEDVDNLLSNDGLMKCSYLLIKSWIVHDSEVPTVKLYPTILTPKLLQLLVFYIFFRYGHFVSHPFIALLLFLHHYSSFDYDTSTIDLDSAIHGYHEMITRDPTLEMKFQLRAQCTTTSVQTLIASCVGVSQETLDQKSEETNSEEHPKSKQHHPCTPQVLVEKFKSLLTEYRSRYEATLIAYTRIVEEPHLDASGNVPYRSDSQYPYYEDPHSGTKVHPKSKFLQRSFMNVADPICTYQNLAEHVSASDVHFIRSVFTNGLHKMIFHLEKLNTHFINIPPTLPPIDMNGEDAATVVDSGSQPTTQTSIADPFESLLFQCFGKTRQISLKHKAQAVTVHDLAFIEQLKKNPCYRDNAIVSSPDILLKQGEFILMGIQNSTGQLQITPTAVANLIVQCLERFGPQLVGDIGKQLQDLTGIPNLPKILKAKYRGLKKVIEAFPGLFRIGTDHIINPTIYLNENRRPGPIEADPNSPGGRIADVSSVAQQSNRHNSGQQSSGGYSNNSSRSNQEKSKWNSNYSQNSRQNENVYRSSGRGAGYSGGYNNRNMDRMVHAETEEYDDGRYYYDQYGGGYIQSHPRGQGYFNYPQSRDARSQYADSRGTQQYSDYEYDPRWNQQDMPRSRSSSHRDQYVDPNLYSDRSYGTDSNLYQPDRGSTRDMRYNQNPPPPQTWTAYQESENPTQRNTSNYYPRSDQRSGGVRQNDEFVPSHEYEEYRRPTEYEPFPGPSHERKQSSGWLDIEGLIGAGAESADHYNGLDPGLDLNFQL